MAITIHASFGLTDGERRTTVEMIARGTYARIQGLRCAVMRSKP